MADRPAAARPFDAVLCDVDNVIRHFDSTHLESLERVAGLAEGTTKKVAFSPEVDGPLLLGRITEQEWVASIARGLAGLVDEETGWALGTALLESPFRADEAVLDLLRRARVRVPLVLVTNATLGLERDLEAMGLTELADDVVSSARVGLAKPDRRILELGAARAGVRPDRCLFVDDTLENIVAATALGMTAVHHRTAADLEKALQPLFT
ncbi:HAD-IA family hydrolase [Streptomyces phaeoluteigriseus]|uniref:HAD-IA family hydrolase n=1 Tax=Streptomyces phaeoluteigriseus TaxID=114686 RepID=A0ABY4ZIZ0_9ACTN|nr:HAD-IA family hydrolase [Streptomyces phaeoluteigriseus]USQ88695.1 HAD-IA family hydrolase [Streptomyces phaeoluteigriseus]